ncbi:MAG: ferredoxin--NADP reductase [Myxococcales bacterium]|nr:ferredoxin--NADP reductase [Myxococcales bacterium]
MSEVTKLQRGWWETKVSHRVDWAPGLFTLRFDADLGASRAGQFINIGLDLDGARVKRAYSLASAPGQPPELYVRLVDDGKLTPHLNRMQVGDPVLILGGANGQFTLDQVTDGKDLWLISTGTGLAPFIAMLRTSQPWERFERVVVVHGVRLDEDLNYEEELRAMSAAHGDRLKWVGTVTRGGKRADVIPSRIPAALVDGGVESAAGMVFSAERSRVMLCGNPQMVEEVTETLISRGLSKHSKKNPGHITAERYW